MKANRLYSHFFKGNKRYFIFAFITAILTILLSFLTPQIIKITVDSVVGNVPFALPQFILDIVNDIGGRDYLRSNLIVCGVLLVAVSLASGLFNFLSRMYVVKGTERLIKRLRDTLFAHVQHLPYKWHMQNQTGDIIQRCTSDVDVIRNFISGQLLEFGRTVILVIVALWLMFSMNVQLTLISLIFIPLIMGYSGYFYTRIAKNFRYADEAEGELMINVQENLTGVRVVRAFGREKHEVERFDNFNDTFANMWIKLGKTMSAYWGIGDIATGLQLVTIVAAGSYFAATGKITLGEFMAFVSYTQSLAWPIRSLGRTLSEMSKTGVSINRVRNILDAQPEQDSENESAPSLAGDIVFDNVSFAYDNQPVLKNLSFTIKQGMTFGVLGATGSGKSTITYLLNRLYDLPEGCGKITINGVDIKNINRAHLRRSVGVVLQEPFLFSKTIEQNIAIAAEDDSLSSVRKSADIAAIDEAITSFSKGYDTIVGERGVTLSGGQKQRVAIARTLMLGSPIMVFDDSLSAIDLETDAKIRRSLSENTGDATVILISHRINTLMGSDVILVLDNGQMSDMGTHEQLTKRDGVYKRIFDMQSAAAGDIFPIGGDE